MPSNEVTLESVSRADESRVTNGSGDVSEARRDVIRPEFMKSRRIKLSVATSGYCNARCELCVWPFMQNDARIMSNTDFARLLEMFRGYRIDKFAFNIINEPFVDKRVGEKLELLAESGLRVKNLFFSSNWLIPDPGAVEAFAAVVARAAAVPQIKRIFINATVCGVDQASYDRHQGGRDLHGTVAPYRHLDFERAVGTVIRFVRALRDQGWPEQKVVVNLKSYGETLDQVTYAAFWRRRLSGAGLEDMLDGGHVQALFNHAFTTFARQETAGAGHGLCRTRWLDARLAVGPGGDIALCCEDGLSGVTIGNLFELGLDGLVGSSTYQRYLAEVLGHTVPPPNSPCVRCGFFDALAEPPEPAGDVA